MRVSAFIRRNALLFVAVQTAVATLFAWFGINRLNAARETGRFDYLWHGVSAQDWPLAFQALSIFLLIWTAVACLFVAIGIASIVRIVVRKAK